MGSLASYDFSENSSSRLQLTCAPNTRTLNRAGCLCFMPAVHLMASSRGSRWVGRRHEPARPAGLCAAVQVRLSVLSSIDAAGNGGHVRYALARRTICPRRAGRDSRFMFVSLDLPLFTRFRQCPPGGPCSRGQFPFGADPKFWEAYRGRMRIESELSGRSSQAACSFAAFAACAIHPSD